MSWTNHQRSISAITFRWDEQAQRKANLLYGGMLIRRYRAPILEPFSSPWRELFPKGPLVSSSACHLTLTNLFRLVYKWGLCSSWYFKCVEEDEQNKPNDLCPRTVFLFFLLTFLSSSSSSSPLVSLLYHLLSPTWFIKDFLSNQSYFGNADKSQSVLHVTSCSVFSDFHCKCSPNFELFTYWIQEP